MGIYLLLSHLCVCIYIFIIIEGMQTRLAGALLIANMGDLIGILWVLAVLISGAQRPKQPLNSETPAEKNGLKKTTEIYFTIVLSANLHKEGLENDRNLARLKKD